jgi:hypothetical protein
MHMDSEVGSALLGNVLRTFATYQSLAERALVQVLDSDLHRLVDPDANSIAVIMKHVAGNLRSRFTDFLTTDGEKPDRNRDGEFEMPSPASREAVLDDWNRAWSIARTSIEALVPGDLMRTIHIRGEALLVVEALHRSMMHTAYHVGEIVLLAKHFAGAGWKSLSIPKRGAPPFTHRQGFAPQ